MNKSLKSNIDQDTVLTKAIINIVNFYKFTGKDLSQIIGLSEATASRLNHGNKYLSANTKEGEMALLLIRVYRSLNALVGNNHQKAILWLNSFNKYFNQIPLDHMKSITGLVSIVNYLDAMRGKL